MTQGKCPLCGVEYTSGHACSKIPDMSFKGSGIEDWTDLRDRFAMAALTGMLGNQTLYFSVLEKCKASKGDINSTFAGFAYEYADALMEARSKSS